MNSSLRRLNSGSVTVGSGAWCQGPIRGSVLTVGLSQMGNSPTHFPWESGWARNHPSPSFPQGNELCAFLWGPCQSRVWCLLGSASAEPPVPPCRTGSAGEEISPPSTDPATPGEPWEGGTPYPALEPHGTALCVCKCCFSFLKDSGLSFSWGVLSQLCWMEMCVHVQI